MDGITISKPIRLLDNDEMQRIHETSIQVLSKVGVVYEAEWALNILKEAGCEVDHKKQIAKIPEGLIEEAINKSQRIVKLCGRNQKYDLTLEGAKAYFAGGANAVKIIEYKGGESFISRPATLEDLIKLTIITDALENIHCYLSPVYPQDVIQKGVDSVKCEIALNYTEKHFYHDAEGYKGALNQIKMASIVVGGEDKLRKKPIISLAPCITSPLVWSENALGVIKACAEKNVPAIISSEPILGATAPVTMAGLLVQQCAEVLSGLTLSHLINPGTPTLVCTLPSVMDMHTASIILGSVETGMMCAASAQLFREFYGMPYVGVGAVSDSKIPDQQAGYEKALTALYGVLGGVNLMHLTSGMLEFLLSVSYEQLIIDNEILGMVLHGVKKLEINDETLALDVIQKVGPRGQFLEQKHTIKYMRKQLYLPTISDRQSREIWEKKGAKNILIRAKEKIEEILKTHEVEPLEEDIKKILRNIREEAQKL